MIDVIEQNIEIGDIVAYAVSNGLKIGMIKKATPKGARIVNVGDTSSRGTFKISYQFVKITPQYNIFKQEHPELFL